ncbi:MAG: methylmalonyl Co-A mutase-associated GTPase MeaB [Planctomycetota bacterium]
MPDFEHQADLPQGSSHLSVDPAANAEAPVIKRPAVRRRELSVDDLVAGVTSGDRSLLARAITLIESANPDHQRRAREVLTRLMPRTGSALRLGITGVPGVGKSTFIDRFGVQRLASGSKVAVLAVDPSSGVTGGSILGDKTRMAELGRAEHAFIRPSPAGATLGGVASKTRETMLLCEAAGFDLIVVETVGVGQSETVVAEMTDVFLALMLPGAGDELQGIKRGLIELADLLAINKADGDRIHAAKAAAGEHRAALRCMQKRHPDWTTPVLTCSARTGDGLDSLWQKITAYHDLLESDGSLAARRRDQSLKWMWSQVDDRLRRLLSDHPAVRELTATIEAEVTQGTLPATAAADRILNAFIQQS